MWQPKDRAQSDSCSPQKWRWCKNNCKQSSCGNDYDVSTRTELVGSHLVPQRVTGYVCSGRTSSSSGRDFGNATVLRWRWCWWRWRCLSRFGRSTNLFLLNFLAACRSCVASPVATLATEILEEGRSNNCWLGDFALLQQDCCDTGRHGPNGNLACWDTNFVFDRCCREEAVTSLGSSGASVAFADAATTETLDPAVYGDHRVNYIEDSVESTQQHKAWEKMHLVSAGIATVIEANRGALLHSFNVRFDFATQTVQLSQQRREATVVAPFTAAADQRPARPQPPVLPFAMTGSERTMTKVPPMLPTLKPSQPAQSTIPRIFVHRVESCAGERLLREFLEMHKPSSSGIGQFVMQQVEHLSALHDAVMRSGALVADPADATIFYVPAFWSLLIEKFFMLYDADGKVLGVPDENSTRLEAMVFKEFADTGRTGHDCITQTFERLRSSPYYTRNAAYDHFWVAGIQHPFNPGTSAGYQLEIFDPFVKNMMIVSSAGDRTYGFADELFRWASPLYKNLQRIFVPYSTTVHCRRLEALIKSPRRRPWAVAFIGSTSSVIRQWTAELAVEPEFARDAAVLLRLGDSSAASAQALRASSRAQFVELAADAINLTHVYMNTDFCLILPGHLHDMTKRCYDAMAQACLPVVVTKPRFWMALPFAAKAPWREIATFRRARSKDELRRIISRLLIRHRNDQDSIRHQRANLASATGLFASHDTDGCTEKERAAFPDFLLGELAARQRVWPHIRSSWLT
eukprot:TRINITY_DN63999_c0_g1_i1.p1 TRINITY_DN63999_c0_g1~~TRINITY_DN63999_c0_g1_i1.p1  ORF type:complete len:747 (-),score=109.95 TRINITY_DN63999_c0_g1_i1:116-2356(-)